MADGSQMSARLRAALRPLVALLLFVIALNVLSHELAATSWRAVITSAKATPWPQVAAAMALTVVNYAVLTGYDFLAFASIGKRLAPWRIGVASFLAYAVANNVGFALISGASIRYRFYTRWGLSAEELSRIIFSYSITLLARPAGAWRLEPCGDAAASHRDTAATDRRALRLDAPGAERGLCRRMPASGRTPIRLWRFDLPLPRPAIAMAQWVVSSADWVLAASVLYVLLLDRGTPFFAVTGAFLTAQLIGLLSHVPGGAGVFEGLIVVLLRPYVAPAELVGPLLLYRGIYYVLPFTVAAVALVLDEAYQRRSHARAHGGIDRPPRRATHTTGAVAADVRRGRRAAFLGSHTGSGRTARMDQPVRAAGHRRNVASGGQPGGRGAATAVAGRRPPS